MLINSFTFVIITYCNMKILFSFTFLTLLFTHFFSTSDAQKINTTAEPVAVTVFASGAEVVNKLNTQLPLGNSEIIIGNVANHLDISSVQVAVPEFVTILSITKKSKDDTFIPTLPQHKLLKDSLEISNSKLQEYSTQITGIQNALKLIQNDKILAGDGTINFTDFSKLVDYYRSKSVELQTEYNKYSKLLSEEKKVNDRLKANYQKISGTAENIVINVNSTKNASVNFQLTYFTQYANWIPFYDLRAENTSSPITFIYKGKIVQNSGVDWKGVMLTLSSGNPNQSGVAPLLNASYVRYYTNTVNYAPSSAPTLTNTYDSLKDEEILTNEDVPDMQIRHRSKSKGPETYLQENVLSMTFDIEIPYDVLSNGLAHSVNLKEFKQNADYKFYSVPKMDKDVFLLAQLTNYESLNLLPGEANVIFENMYVGKTYIDPRVTTDTLSLGMGRDRGISVTRERVNEKSSSSTLGSNKKDTYEYEIKIRNNKKQSVNLHVKDQYPLSSDKFIEVELVDNGGAEVNKEIGVLNWQLNLKPGETKILRFKFTVKYPKNKPVIFN